MAAFFDKIRNGFSRTRQQVFGRFSNLLNAKRKIDDDLLEEIEEVLISGDVGVDTSLEIIERIKTRVRKERFETADQLWHLLKDEISGIFPSPKYQEHNLTHQPHVILVVGVNGTGKTTTVAKLGHRLKQQNKRVLLAAADTFRAAAIDQLQTWAERLDLEIIHHQAGSDPAAVAFDAVSAAVKREADVLLIDTAGRLHTKVNLMNELQKIKRVIQKVIPQAPHQTILVLDGTTGQNAMKQAQQFIQVVDVDGLVITKLDGTAKGGAAIGISHQLNLPIQYIGVGESTDDLLPFEPMSFAEGLFEQKESTP